MSRLIVGAVVAAMFIGATPLVAESKSGSSKVDPALLAEAKANPNGLFAVIVRGASPADKKSDNKIRTKRAEDALFGSNGSRRTLSIVGAASGTLRGAQIVALSNMPSVD